MINRELVDPQSIVIVGGSNNVQKPGGKIIRNLLEGNFKGDIYAVNPKETEVQGVEHGADVGREELDFGREGIIDPSHDSKKRGSHMPWRER